MKSYNTIQNGCFFQSDFQILIFLAILVSHELVLYKNVYCQRCGTLLRNQNAHGIEELPIA